MKRRITVIIILLISTQIYADLYYARKRLKLRSSPKLGAQIVATVNTREKVNVVDRSNARYWLVEYKGKKGYVYYKWLTKAKGVDVEKALEASGAQKERLVELRSDGAIRGLTEEAAVFARNSAEITEDVKDDFEYITSIKIADKLEDFLKEGRLGEYAYQ